MPALRPTPALARALARRLPLAALLALAACGPASDADPGADAAHGPAGDRPPSIVLLSLDTVRADRTSLYGYERATTPYLEELAREAVVYDAAYSVASWTLVSHMTMLTGLEPAQHGVTEGEHALAPRIPTLAERLRKAGYRTLGFHFPGWTGPRHGFARGFDVYESHADAEEAGEHVARALAAGDPSRPTFLFVQLFDAHCKDTDGTYYEPPPPYDRAFCDDACAERLARVPWHPVREQQRELPEEVLVDLGAMYDGGVRYVDAVLERWIEGWRAEGRLDDAVLVITSDHGESLGTRHGTIKGHGGLFEEGIRVPLLVRWPDGRGAGTRVAAPVGHVDLVPTFLEVAGLPADPRLPGYSLADPPPDDRTLVASQGDFTVLVRAPWKVTLFGSADAEAGRAVDLTDDPDERRPFHHAHPKRRDRFVEARAAALRALAAERAGRDLLTADPVPAGGVDAAERAKLDALGYAGY